MKRILRKYQIDRLREKINSYYMSRSICNAMFELYNKQHVSMNADRIKQIKEIEEKYLTSRLKRYLYKKQKLNIPEMNKEINAVQSEFNDKLTAIGRKYFCSMAGYYVGPQMDLTKIDKEIDVMTLDGFDGNLSDKLKEFMDSIDSQRKEILEKLNLTGEIE